MNEVVKAEDHIIKVPSHGDSLDAFYGMLQVSHAHEPVIQAVLLDLPGLLFFSTYTLLVLFWAEIYHQARSLPTSKLRPIFVTANAVVYIVQVPLSPSNPLPRLCRTQAPQMIGLSACAASATARARLASFSQ